MILSYQNGVYRTRGHTYADRLALKAAHFVWNDKNPADKFWWSGRNEDAEQLVQYADSGCLERLQSARRARSEAVAASHAVYTRIRIPVPEGLHYFPYQQAGIAYAINRPATLIADEMGLGKSIQAIGVINALPSIRNLLIICPASLRINWHRALDLELPEKSDLVQERAPGPETLLYGHEPAKAVLQEPKVQILPAESKAALPSLTTGEIALIHKQLRYLAGLDNDRTSQRNGAGFNRLDGTIGHSLAEQPHLSVRQALLGQGILKKYRRQLECVILPDERRSDAPST